MGSLLGRALLGCKNEGGVLRKLIYYHQHPIAPLTHGKAHDEVHEDALPWPFGNEERL